MSLSAVTRADEAAHPAATSQRQRSSHGAAGGGPPPVSSSSSEISVEHSDDLFTLRRRATASSTTTSSSMLTSTSMSTSPASSIRAPAEPSGDVPLASIFLIVLAVRVLNALATRTFFQPDEFWQSLEVAHRSVFGYGYLTWEWRTASDGSSPLRSFAHPLVFVPGYWLLRVLRLDDTFLLRLVPRLLQAVFAALTDLETFRLADALLGTRGAWAALLSSLFNVYGLHTGARTFSNALETLLCLAALRLWPLSLPADEEYHAVPDGPLKWSHLRKSLALAALAIIIRPTAAIIWLFLGVRLFHSLSQNICNAGIALERAFTVVLLVPDVLVIGVAALLFTVMLDSWHYGTLAVTPIAFLRRNVLDSLSLFYGVSPLHFYFSSALPVLGFTTLPFMLQGFWAALRPDLLGVDESTRRRYGVRGERDPVGLQSLAYLTIWTVLAYSALGHKEFRFIQPLLPVLHIFAGYAFALLTGRIAELLSLAAGERQIRQQRRLQQNAGATALWHLGNTVRGVPRALRRFKTAWQILARRRYAQIALMAHLPFAAYLLLFHCRGQVEVMDRIRQLHRAGSIHSAAFLMPCHSTPWQSHLHTAGLEIGGLSGEGGLLWFITCEPPDRGTQLATYRDQSDVFYDDVHSYLAQRFPPTVDPVFPPSPAAAALPSAYLTGSGPKHTWPSHLVVFEELLGRSGQSGQSVAGLLAERGYAEQERLWNSHFHDDSRRLGDILILGWTGQTEAEPAVALGS